MERKQLEKLVRETLTEIGFIDHRHHGVGKVPKKPAGAELDPYDRLRRSGKDDALSKSKLAKAKATLAKSRASKSGPIDDEDLRATGVEVPKGGKEYLHRRKFSPEEISKAAKENPKYKAAQDRAREMYLKRTKGGKAATKARDASLNPTQRMDAVKLEEVVRRIVKERLSKD